MKALITGATGFIGSRMALRLKGQGHDVTALGQTNNPLEEERLAALRDGGVTPVLASLFDRDEVRRAAEDCDVVIHLAAAQHEANVPDSHFRKVNVDGVRLLLDVCVDAGITRFVHGSTIGVYGDAGENILDEKSPTNPQNIYGVTKLEGEKLALSYSNSLHVVAVRISETYGPGDGRLLKLFRAVANGSFVMIGAGTNRRQLVHVDDLADALWQAGQTDAANGEVIVVAGSEVLTTAEMVDTIARTLGKKPRSWRLPMWPFLWLAWVMEQTLGRVGIQPPLHRRRLDFFRKSFVFRNEKAERLLEFSPKINFSEGARETADWYREHGKL